MRKASRAIVGAAMIVGLSGPAGAAGEGLSGFQLVDIQVDVPRAQGTPCQINDGLLRQRIIEKLQTSGVGVGTSALTLRASVTTLSDAIQRRCISAVRLEAFTAQTTVIQATRNSITANIPLWSVTSIASSDARGHSERMGSAVAILSDKFVAVFKANR